MSRSSFIHTVIHPLEDAIREEDGGRGDEALRLLCQARERLGRLVEDFHRLVAPEENAGLSMARLVDDNGIIHWGPFIYRVPVALAGQRVRMIGEPSTGPERIEYAEPGENLGRPVKFHLMGSCLGEPDVPCPKDREGTRSREDAERPEGGRDDAEN